MKNTKRSRVASTDTAVFDSQQSKVRQPYRDPRQIRYVGLLAKQREIAQELRHLKQELFYGTCDVCGAVFHRVRVTKRYCSQACTSKASNDSQATYDIDLIRHVWPILSSSGMLSATSVDVVARQIAVGSSTMIAGEFGISRQRVSQILHRATQMARVVRMTQQSIQPPATSETKGAKA